MTHSTHRVGFIGLLLYPFVAAVLVQPDVASSPEQRFTRAEIEEAGAITAGVAGGQIAKLTAAERRGAEVLGSLHRTDDAADALALWSKTDTGYGLREDHRLRTAPDSALERVELVQAPEWFAGRLATEGVWTPLLRPSTGNALTAHWRMTPERFVGHAAEQDDH